MTPQLLTVKIQALVGGRLGLSDVQKRSLALEYYKHCEEAETRIEHCVALIKTGREYPAIQVAESTNLLDCVNVLVFPELQVWRELCSKEGLPVPQPFDDEQIRLIASLYSKGITQAHPLYRDYRRAMRKRDWRAALAVIRTIAKINSYDAEAVGEYGRLRKRVTDAAIAEIDGAIRAGDTEKVCSLVSATEQDAEILSDNSVWKNALEICGREESRRNALECRKILHELSAINLESDWERASELVSRFNFARGDSEFSAAELETVENAAKVAAKKQDAEILRERGARAVNLAALELEKGGASANPRETLAKLGKILSELPPDTDPKLARGIRRKMASVRGSAFLSAFVKFAVRAAAVALILFFSWSAWRNYESSRAVSSALSELDDIALIDDPAEFDKRMETFGQTHKNALAESAVQSKISALRGDIGVVKTDIERLGRLVGGVESQNLKTAPSQFFDTSRNDLERAYSELAGLPRKEQILLKERIEKATKNLEAEIDARKTSNAAQTRRLLDAYEAVLAKYVSFSGSVESIDAEADGVLAKLRPLMEDISMSFKAHRIDTDRYNDISARIADARSKFAKFDSLRESLMGARTRDEYLSALDFISLSGEVPPDFSRKVSRIIAQKDAVKIGNLADFIDIRYAGETPPEALSRMNLPDSKMLFDVWKYTHPKRGDVYVIGQIRQTSQKWGGGSETVQYAEEISLGGRATTSVYRMTELAGRSPRGELLSGGVLTQESMLGRAVASLAAKEPAISALMLIGNTNVNSVFRAYLENIVFADLAKNPVESGLAFSPSARKRAARLAETSNSLFDYSWIFENKSKEKYLSEKFYSELAPDYLSEAISGLEAFRLASKNPLRFIGVCDEKGAPKFFGVPSGSAIWAVNAESGLFGKIAGDTSLYAPLSPVFEETLSKEKILESAK